MKPVNDSLIVQARKPSAHAPSQKHDQVVAAFLARIFKVGSMADRLALHDWAKATVHTPAVGGYGENLYGEWLDQQLEKLAAIEAAGVHVTKHGKRLSKELPKRREDITNDIEALEDSIRAMQESLTERRGALAEVEAEAAELKRCEDLIGQTEADAEDGTPLGLAHRYATRGEHPFA